MERIPERLDVAGAETADGETAGMGFCLSVLDRVDGIEAPYPHRVALDDGRRRLSPFLLGVTVRRLARAILDLAPPGPVGVALHEGTMGIVAVLGALAAGRDCVLIDPARVADSADGCACLVVDPADGAATPSGPVVIDVFLSCSAAYAEARPSLPDVAADAVAISFGSLGGAAHTLERLIAGLPGERAPHCAASGLLSCPHCLGGALAALAAGGEIRIGAGCGCGWSAATTLSERR